MASFRQHAEPSFHSCRSYIQIGRRAFTLIELLISIAIIAMLLSLLMPALSSARGKSRMMVCLANVRSQGMAIQQYANEHEGRLPPQSFMRTHRDGQIKYLALNEFMARYDHEPFPEVTAGFSSPIGKWRCPEVSIADDHTRQGHSGIFHHAPNRYLYNYVNIDDDGDVSIWAEAYPGWEDRYASSRWRTLEQINRIDETIALMDNINYYNSLHGHRDALDSYGRACDVPSGDTICMTDAHGSHDRLGKRPAVFTDGHAAAMTSSPEYWLATEFEYRTKASYGIVDLYTSEVRHLMWFVRGTDAANGPANISPPKN